jgi:hypothetical protein
MDSTNQSNAGDFIKSMPENVSLDTYLKKAVDYIIKMVECENAGIRVKDGKGNIPFAALNGFDNEEWRKTEFCLSLEKNCVCTRINKGNLDPYEIEFTTPFGSFHIDSPVNFAKGLTEEQSKRYIGKCSLLGTSTVALIPLVRGGEILGNIHLADTRDGYISSEKVAAVEKIATEIAQIIYTS